jgi:acyl-CoA synthetase (NDP forming)
VTLPLPNRHNTPTSQFTHHCFAQQQQRDVISVVIQKPNSDAIKTILAGQTPETAATALVASLRHWRMQDNLARKVLCDSIQQHYRAREAKLVQKHEKVRAPCFEGAIAREGSPWLERQPKRTSKSPRLAARILPPLFQQTKQQ